MAHEMPVTNRALPRFLVNGSPIRLGSSIAFREPIDGQPLGGEMAHIALVVMEPGSEWPGHVGEAETLVALRSLDGTLLRSTQSRIAALKRAHDHVRVAVLACNDATDDAATGERASVARELLASVVGERRGHLVITAPESRMSPQLMQHLLTLTGALNDGLRGTSATLTLKTRGSHADDRILSWSPAVPIRKP